jgi:6-phosphogluconate dehydrogenase
MREAAKQYSWKLNYGSIALMWRGGCIIRRLVFFVLEGMFLIYLICFKCIFGKYKNSL